MEIVDPKIESYLETLYLADDPVLKEMENLGSSRNFPIVGRLVGNFLYQLTKISRASSVFEMGSGFGYSAYWFAMAIPPTGFIYHTDLSSKNSKMAQEFMRKGRLINKVRFLAGNALDLLADTREIFDIIFIDIEKEDYPAAYEKARRKIKPGGLLIADNALWFGRVLEKKGDKATEGIKKFNQLLSRDKDFVQVIVPLRDGVSVNFKLR